MFNRFPHFRQLDEMDCGPSCLRIICKFYGKQYSLQFLRSLSFTSRQGSSLLHIADAAGKLGLKTAGAKMRFQDLATVRSGPFIVYWNQKHFVVVYKATAKKVYVSDPAYGLLTYSREEFIQNWTNGDSTGIALLVSKGEQFGQLEETKKPAHTGFPDLFRYVLNYKMVVFHILLGLIAASILQLALPFLTQSIIDIGISQGNYQFIYLILLAQLGIFIGRTFLEIIRGHLLLYLSTRINIILLTGFFAKLMNLPISYYDRKMNGDILQRINDHTRVESFVTSGLLNVIFSTINLVVFGVVLSFYSLKILLVFLLGSFVYFLWISSFARKRAMLDTRKFQTLVATNEKNLEMLAGMQEIKLGNAEKNKRYEWEQIQLEQFRVNLKSLALKQVQIDVASVINELKNVLIAFVAATLVIQGSISLGIMLSISFIIGQLNAPILLITQFLQEYQDSRLSMERISEVHAMENETESTGDKTVPVNTALSLSNVYFKYSNATSSPFILKNISFAIPYKKVTAIVGASGSGKTTLLKLLLKFYEPASGDIFIGDHTLGAVHHSLWRNKCGAVMQEGYLFNDTIARNIALGQDSIDQGMLAEACRIANIHDFITQLPLKFDTKIGPSGLGLSAGQKQRILIARAVYKQPEFLFFDEATSALDANNERQIINNLHSFFVGRTVVIVAHRLSTVFNADQIIVLQDGEVVEQGVHSTLVSQKGRYFHLIKNQLELGQ